MQLNTFLSLVADQFRFIGALAAAGSVLWDEVVPPAGPSVRPFRRFVGIGSLVFLNFGILLVTHVTIWSCRWQSQISSKKSSQTGRKWIFWIFKNLVINFVWICFIMKFYIMGYGPAEVSFLGRICFLRCGAKYSWPIRLQGF